LKEIVLYVEGDSDKAIVEELLRHLTPGMHTVGVRLLPPRPAQGNSRLLDKITAWAALGLRTFSTLAVFALKDSDAPADQAGEILNKLAQAGAAKLAPGEVDRFHPHVAVPEIEAWLLADEEAVADYLRRFGVNLSESWPCPEHLFDGKAELDKLFVKIPGFPRRYKPTTDGPLIARRVRPEIVAEKCPRFRAFIENLKRTAGLPVES